MDEGVLKDLLVANPRDEAAAEALLRILSEGGRWDELVQLMLDRLEQSGGARPSLYLRLAETLHEKLNQSSDALVVLLEGLAETQAEEQLGDLIAQVAGVVGDWQAVFDAYEILIKKADAPLHMHRRLADWYGHAGRRTEEMIHRSAVAKLDPKDERNASGLETYYEDSEAWDELVALLESRLESLESGPDRVTLYTRVGGILEERMQRPKAALDWYGVQFVQQPTEELFEKIVHLTQLTTEYERVCEILERALAGPHGGGTIANRTSHLLATLFHHQLQNLPKAQTAYQSALASGVWDEDVAAELRSVSRHLEDWSTLVERIAVDVEQTTDTELKFALLKERAELLAERLNQPDEAIEAWYGALELKPDDKPTLVQLMDLFRATEQWEASIKALKKLTALEMNLQRRAQFFHAIGVIQRDKLSDNQTAVRSFDLALEFDPTFLRAFQAIDEILNDEQNFERQDRYYRKMLVRALDNELDPHLIARIARNLGEINRGNLGDAEEAVKAFDIAIRYGDTDRELYQMTAELEASVGQVDGAAAKYIALIKSDPTDLEAYHALVTLYCGAHRLDEAYCVCQVLSALGHATPEEAHLERSVRTRHKAQQLRPMKAEAWALVSAGFSYPQIGELLKWMTPPILDTVALSERALGISKAEPSDHARRLTKLTSSILQLAEPEVKTSDRFLRVGIAHLATPALLMHPDIGTHSRAEQLYCAVRSLFLLDHRHYLATVDQDHSKRTQRMRNLLATVHQWLMPDRAQPGCLNDLLALLNEAGAHDRDICLELIAPLLSMKDYGVSDWLRSVERAANRIAFTICDDLSTAIRMVRQDPYPVSDESANERIVDLLHFAISSEYRGLRQTLCLAIPSPELPTDEHESVRRPEDE